MTVPEMHQIGTKYILGPLNKNAVVFNKLIDRTYGFLTRQTTEFMRTLLRLFPDLITNLTFHINSPIYLNINRKLGYFPPNQLSILNSFPILTTHNSQLF